MVGPKKISSVEMAQGCYVRKTAVSSQEFPPLEAGGTEVAKTGELEEHGKARDLLVLKEDISAKRKRTVAVE